MAITPITIYPQSTDPAGEFAPNGDAFIKQLATQFVPEANDLEENVNALESTFTEQTGVATAQAAIATSQAGIAMASANYKGLWAGLSGSYPKGISVGHNGSFWALNDNLADISASEPSISNNSWSLISPLPMQSGNTGKILKTDGSTASWTNEVDGLILGNSSYNQTADATISTGTHTFNYALGDMQQITATGDITLTFSNFPIGKVASMIIDAVNFGAHTITHPATMIFTSGIAPYYTVSGTDRLMIIKDKDEVYSLFVIGRNIKVVA